MNSIARNFGSFLPKAVDETDVLTFDYTDSLTEDELILSAVLTVTVEQGADASPAAILSGAAEMVTPAVLQKIVGGLRNVTYFVTCAATTDLGRVLISAGRLPVIVPGQP
jgi:hypothetical protein